MKVVRLVVCVAIGGLFIGHGTQRLSDRFGGPGPQGTEQMMQGPNLDPPRRNALAVTADWEEYFPVIDVPVLSGVGAGDNVVAASAAMLTTLGTQPCRRQDAERPCSNHHRLGDPRPSPPTDLLKGIAYPTCAHA